VLSCRPRLPGGLGERGGTVLVLNLMLIGLAVALDPLPLTASSSCCPPSAAR